MKIGTKLLLALVGLGVLFASVIYVSGQSNPGLTSGQVPTAAEWNLYFSQKWDNGGYTPLNPANNLTDVANLATAKANLGVPSFTPLNPANNLSDVASIATAKSNLGVPSFTPLNPANNLSDVANTTTAAANLGITPSLILEHVATNAALKALTGGSVPVIVRDGYTTAGDGGAATYVWGSSACTVSAGAGDNGWQVKPTTGSGCWTASFPATGADVRAWGAASGANVDTALNAAVNFACSTHIPIYLPYPPAGTYYYLNSEIDIGNGSSSAFSTCNGVSFFMTASNIEGASAVNFNMAFQWNGSGGTIPFVVKGPGSAFTLKGIGIDCNNICGTAFKLINTLDSTFEFLGVWNQTGGPAFYLTSIPGNNQGAGSEFNKIRNWKAINPGTNGSGLQIGETTTSGSNLSVITNTLIDIGVNWDGTCGTCYGIQLGLANQNTIINPILFPVGGSSGNSLKVVQVTGLTTFPTDNLFVHPQFGAVANDPGGSWTGTVGQTFIDYSIASAVFPSSTVPALYSGTDSKGFSYPRGTWTPTDGSGASLTLTVTDATYVINNKMCTVSFDITYPSTANGSNLQVNGLPCTPQAGTNGVYGGAPSYTNQGSTFTIYVSQGATNFQLYNTSGGQLTNASMSTKQFRGTLTFPAQ
jgi:hypothetical protein